MIKEAGSDFEKSSYGSLEELDGGPFGNQGETAEPNMASEFNELEGFDGGDFMGGNDGPSDFVETDIYDA